MKIVVFGKTGQVGNAIYSTLKNKYKNFFIHYYSSSEINKKIKKADFLKISTIKKIINSEKPDIIINASAYTNVDKAEIERKKAFTINGEVPKVIANECKKKNIFFIHFSTDYVFDGKTKTKYTEESLCKPINYYGKTKLYAEKAIVKSKCKYLILRLSGVYGEGKKNNFIKKIIYNLKNNGTINVVDDQYGNLTPCELITKCLLNAISKFGRGDLNSAIYHLCSKKSSSKLDVAKYILKNHKFFKNKVKFVILPIKSDALNSLAARPKNSSLSTSRVERDLRLVIKTWDFYLKKYLKKI